MTQYVFVSPSHVSPNHFFLTCIRHINSTHTWSLFDLFSCAFQVGFSSHLNGHIHSTDILHPYINKCSPSVSIDKYCQTNNIYLPWDLSVSLQNHCTSARRAIPSSSTMPTSTGSIISSIIGDKSNQEKYIPFFGQIIQKCDLANKSFPCLSYSDNVVIHKLGKLSTPSYKYFFENAFKILWTSFIQFILTKFYFYIVELEFI